jgi:Ca2+-binding RTX toxin-like protein
VRGTGRHDCRHDGIQGGAGDDQLFAGGAGVLDGKTRPDWLEGGGGDDLLDIGESEPSASGPSGTVVFTSSPTAIVVDLTTGTATGEGDDIIVPRPGLEVVGSAFADVIDGSDRDDWLYGYVGDDRVRGLGGNDELILDSQDSEYISGSNDDQADGGPGDDHLYGAEGADTLRGGPGTDTVESWGYAPSGPSQLYGDAGDDHLRARLTDEHLLVDGGSGHDAVTLKSPLSNDPQQSRVTVRMVPQTLGLGTLTVGQIRRIESVAVLDRMQLDYYGSPRADRVYAGEDSRLRAWTLGGADLVHGSRRSDFVDSGPGHDAVWAAGGRDTCHQAERRSSCEALRPRGAA